MPDEISRGVKAALDNLEQYSLTNNLCRSQSYTKILTALEKDEELSLSVTERLLAVCVHDMRDDMRYTANIMNIISAIVSRVQNGRYDPAPDLVPSALVVINTIKTTALLSKVESLKQLCFDTLLSYPTDILIAVSDLHQEIIEIFNLYCHLKIPIKMRVQACMVLHRLLKILPQEKKRQFIEKGLPVWFSKIIPSCMVVEISQNIIMVETLELLTDGLVEIDYSDNEHWQSVLERICSTLNYPAMMKTLLEHGSDIWHRVWIVFIRLLKHQVTLCLGTIGTPINSMLPVVETAFKEDVISRCRAFECWNVLIDNFSTETNESNINKRLKLLLIPLRSNNAKAEETALAKFKCWWHLIEKFQNKIDKFIDTILVCFLHFCFGKHNSSEKSSIIPGQISTAVKKQCIQALVEMVGHVNCEGCTDLPKLTGGKLINTKNLVDNWNHWVFSLTSAIMMSTNSDSGLTQQQMTCLWKSYLMTIGELPENNIRKDLFAEMLSIISELVKHCKSSAKLSELILNALVLSLFDEDVRLKQLLKTKVNDDNRPVCTIILVLMDPTFHLAYHSCSFEEMVTKLTPVTDFLLDPFYCAPIFATGFVLENLPATDMGLILWTALAESILEFGLEFVTCDKILIDTIVWPLQIVNSFTNLKTSAMTWYTLYDTLYPKLKHFEILVKSISTFLLTAPAINHSTTYLKLCVLLCWLKNKMAGQTCSASDRELELLHVVTSRIDSYQNYESLFPLLVDRLVATVGILLTNVNETAARYTLFCMKKIIKVMTLTCRQITEASLILSFINILLNSLDSLVQAESYHRFIPVIIDEIIDCAAFLSQQSATKKSVLSVMKTVKSKVVETDETFKKLQEIIDDVENETIAKDKNQSSENNKFTTPKTKVAKRTKIKKEASIVNTVVENGEEYVVVKSNWKFNPRKLTENQKEKLQRKREDIPALYQDLSQSQDEFKLVSWKTDSQDTSNSSKSESKSCSKSGSTETSSVMLSNLPSSEVVPKILENFFAENVKKDNTAAAKEISSVDKKVKNIKAVTPKNSKSPRMALKDRVFRNVRNLIEHSEVHKENKSVSEDLNKTESIIKTPTQSKNDETANIVNSAPPMISADRPSRVKRKPKKFDELQLLLGAKKRRQTLQDLKCESKQSNPSATDSSKDATPPASDNVTCEEEVNKVNDVQVPENANSSDANVVIQINDNSQKQESEINKNEIEMEEALPTKMDLEASLDIIKPEDNMENEQNNDYLNEENVDGTNEKKVEKINEERVEIPNEGDCEKVVESSTENGPTKNMIESTTENTPTKKMIESSTENSPTKKGVESSTENSPTKMVAESSTEKKLRFTGKKIDSPMDKKAQSSTKKTVVSSDKKIESPMDKKAQSSTIKSVVSSTEKKMEGPMDKKAQSSTKKRLESSTENKIESPMDAKAQISTTIKSVVSSTEKKLESSMDKKAQSSTIKSVISSTEKKIDSPMNKKAQNSTKKRAESSTENETESPMDKKAQSSTKQSVEISTEKDIEIVQDSKIEGSKNTKGDTCNTIKTNKKKKKEKVNDVHDNCPIDNKDKINTIKEKKTKMVKEKSNDIHDNRSCDNKEMSYAKKEESLNDENGDKSSEIQTSLNKKDAKEPSTPQQETKNKGTEEQKSTTKKCFRKSRIETELAIDMVEGHPYLNMQSQKRLTRKALESAGTGRRKSLIEKLAKCVSGAKSDKKTKEKNRDGDSSSSNSSLAVDDSQGLDIEMKDQTSFTEDMPHSDDVIESSQDSTITTISVKSTKKKVPVVSLAKIDLLTGKVNESQSILDCVMVISESAKANQEGKDDSELPLNKTASEVSFQADLTENLDTEPIEDKDLSEVVILANDDLPEPLTISSDETVVGAETQEIAEADTQPTDLNNFMEAFVVHKNTDTSLTVVETNEIPGNKKNKSPTKNKSISEKSVHPLEDVTITLSDSAVVELEKESGASSPSSFGDEAIRKQDFLNNTLEISPIKNMSPDRNKKSPSPETSNDFVVITLSSPVHSNGEPFEKCGSPEVFTEDKVSPDKRDQSPPRVEITVTNTSPSSSLSLKKNRPQVRAGGRAAQMLGLCCVPDKVQAIINQEKAETDEIKKTSSTSTPARRNLRILYNSVSENIEPSCESEDSETFLKFRRSLPAVDSSPSGPILKRKLVEISDDATISPASKRKRVSFHDPPVSTTVSVQKYIEPGGVRSPQNSTHKRLERQLRQQTLLKSPKRLDHAFKLDTVLNRAVESFSDTTIISTPDDTQQFSLDETPVVEIVRASELNDTDPICPDLVNCQDHIDTIASGLSSYTMKSLLVQELVGKVTTVGDLARLTEVEVNRLCIKAPKVKVAKKVLTDYVSKREEKTPSDVMEDIDEALFDEPMPEVKTYVDGEAQTNTNVCVETEAQTVATPTSVTCVQTETTLTAHTIVQTDESGSKSTADIVKSCLAERPDFVEQVSLQLEDSSIQQITDKLPLSAITDVLMKKITPSGAKDLLNKVLEDQWNNTTEQNCSNSNKELSFIQDYMCGRFHPKDLILFCSDLLKSVYDKAALP